MAQKLYPVLRRLMHDDDIYDPIEKPGVTVVLDEEVADPLVDLGVLGEGSDAPAGPKKSAPPAA